jgi:hypothetical protein
MATRCRRVRCLLVGRAILGVFRSPLVVVVVGVWSREQDFAAIDAAYPPAWQEAYDVVHLPVVGQPVVIAYNLHDHAPAGNQTLVRSLPSPLLLLAPRNADRPTWWCLIIYDVHPPPPHRS